MLKLSKRGKGLWSLITIYANLDNKKRWELWTNLIRLSARMVQPWLLARDFNDIRDLSEKKGGYPFNWRKANVFNENIHKCGLLELTCWVVVILGKALKWMARIDFLKSLTTCFVIWSGGLDSMKLKIEFFQGFFSNHHPLKLTLRESKSLKNNKPFRFEVIW